MDRKQKRRASILRILKEEGIRVTSSRITQLLLESGIEISERSIRTQLNELVEEGVVTSSGRKGCSITEAGLDQLKCEQMIYGIGYLSAKIDQMTYRMTFDLARRSGSVVVNTSLVDIDQFRLCWDEIFEVFRKGYAMGNKVAIIPPGEQIDQMVVPKGKIGFCTVCSVTLNGVLLKHGIPIVSRFGGLLEIRKGKPTRFVEIIHYDATSIDPLEVFIRSGMADYKGVIAKGEGRIGASFREVPSDCRDLVLDLAERLDDIGLGGFMKIGLPGQTVLETPVSEGRIGAVLVGGLNPVSILEESGYRINARAMSGLFDYSRLVNYEDVSKRLKLLM